MLKGREFIGVAIILFVFWPWIVGIVDLISWMITSNQVSNIPWVAGGPKPIVYSLWPIISGFIIMLVASLF